MQTTRFGDNVTTIARDHVDETTARRLGDFAQAMAEVGTNTNHVVSVLTQYVVIMGAHTEAEADALAGALLVKLP